MWTEVTMKKVTFRLIGGRLEKELLTKGWDGRKKSQKNVAWWRVCVDKYWNGGLLATWYP